MNSNNSEDIQQSMFERNKKYFMDHEDELKDRYPELYVAIHNDTILGTCKDLGSLAGWIYRKYGNIPFYASIPGENRIEHIDFPIC